MAVVTQNGFTLNLPLAKACCRSPRPSEHIWQWEKEGSNCQGQNLGSSFNLECLIISSSVCKNPKFSLEGWYLNAAQSSHPLTPRASSASWSRANLVPRGWELNKMKSSFFHSFLVINSAGRAQSRNLLALLTLAAAWPFVGKLVLKSCV